MLRGVICRKNEKLFWINNTKDIELIATLLFLQENERMKKERQSNGGTRMLEGLLWLRDTCEAYCVTFAQGLNETELLRRFGGDLSWARLVQKDDWDGLEELGLFGQIIQVGWCEGWAFVYENNGYTGTRPEVLHAVSAGTVAVAVFRNVNAVPRFCYAEDGTVSVNFDPIAPPFEDASPQTMTLLRQAGITPKSAEGGGFGFVGAMFALAEAAGVRFDRKAIEERPLLSSFIRNPFSDFVSHLLTQGGDEQTAKRLLALLDDKWQPWQTQNLIHILDSGRVILDGRHILDGRYIVRNKQQREHLDAVAVRVVRALHSVQIIFPLLVVLRKGNQELRSAVSEILKALIRFDQRHDQEGARERLLALVSAAEPEVARHAALALGTLGDQRAVEPLVRVLSLYPHEREIVHLLGQLRAHSAVEPLQSLLNPQDENIDFQRALLKALTQIGGAQVVERLMRMLHSEPQSLRECSFQQALLASLAQLGDSHIVEPLLELLNPHAESHYAFDFQLHLLKAFGNLGEKRAVEPLAQLLNQSVRSASGWYFQERLARTLRQLGDTRAALETVELSLQHRPKITERKAFIHPRQHPNG
jgi:HEAT repeat protein